MLLSWQIAPPRWPITHQSHSQSLCRFFSIAFCDHIFIWQQYILVCIQHTIATCPIFLFALHTPLSTNICSHRTHLLMAQLPFQLFLPHRAGTVSHVNLSHLSVNLSGHPDPFAMLCYHLVNAWLRRELCGVTVGLNRYPQGFADKHLGRTEPVGRRLEH